MLLADAAKNAARLERHLNSVGRWLPPGRADALPSGQGSSVVEQAIIFLGLLERILDEELENI